MERLRSANYISDLIFMNTPFIKCEKSNVAMFLGIIQWSLVGAWLVAGLLTMNSRWSAWTLPGFVLTMFLAFLISEPGKKYLVAYQERLWQILQPLPPTSRLLNVTCGDEINLWLGLLHYLSYIPFRLWLWAHRMGIKLLMLVFAISAVCAIVGTIIVSGYGNRVNVSSPAGTIVDLLWFGFGCFGTMVPITMGLAAVFGLPFLLVLFVFPQAVHGSSVGFGDELVQNLLLVDSSSARTVTPRRKTIRSLEICRRGI
jgi:hypothetical protein